MVTEPMYDYNYDQQKKGMHYNLKIIHLPSSIFKNVVKRTIQSLIHRSVYVSIKVMLLIFMKK